MFEFHTLVMLPNSNTRPAAEALKAAFSLHLCTFIPIDPTCLPKSLLCKHAGPRKGSREVLAAIPPILPPETWTAVQAVTECASWGAKNAVRNAFFGQRRSVDLHVDTRVCPLSLVSKSDLRPRAHFQVDTKIRRGLPDQQMINTHAFSICPCMPSSVCYLQCCSRTCQASVQGAHVYVLSSSCSAW